MKKCLLFITLFLGGVLNGRVLCSAAVSPSAVDVKVYEMRVSKNSDCSSPIVVFKTASPVSGNFFNNPTLDPPAGAAVPVGTYNCVMFNISDQVTVTAPQGVCAGGYTVDIFAAATDESVAPDGTIIKATAMDDKPWIYFTNSATAKSANNCYEPGNGTGCACSGPCPINTPLTVSKDQTNYLAFNLTSLVDGLTDPTKCAILLPDGISNVTTPWSVH